MLAGATERGALDRLTMRLTLGSTVSVGVSSGSVLMLVNVAVVLKLFSTLVKRREGGGREGTHAERAC